MSDRNGYDPGTPSWVDLSTPDVEASAKFYGELFGWEAVEAGPPEETGGYRIIMREGKAVGGMMGLMDPNQPPRCGPPTSRSRTPTRPRGGRATPAERCSSSRWT